MESRFEVVIQILPPYRISVKWGKYLDTTYIMVLPIPNHGHWAAHQIVLNNGYIKIINIKHH